MEIVDKRLQSHAGLDGVKFRSDLGHMKIAVGMLVYMISVSRLYPPKKRMMQLESKAQISDWLEMYDWLFNIPFHTGELGLKERIGFGELYP